jgi:hypothetical protein
MRVPYQVIARRKFIAERRRHSTAHFLSTRAETTTPELQLKSLDENIFLQHRFDRVLTGLEMLNISATALEHSIFAESKDAPSPQASTSQATVSCRT